MLSLLVLCLVLSPSLRAARQGDALLPAKFPSLTTYSLDKAKVDLPAGFEGKVNLVLISFAPEQAKDIDTWMPTAQALQHMNFQFRYYRMPVSSEENFIFRWWDTSSLRGVETDPLTWHWIIPLYTNKDTFRHALDIANEKQIVLVLVDRSGQVLWKTSGRITGDKKASLTNAVAAATHLP